MPDEPAREIPGRRYHPLGLAVNPFKNGEVKSHRGTYLQGVAVHSAVAGLLAALNVAAEEERSTPIWIGRAKLTPAPYILTALADSIAVLSRDDDLDVLPVYVPLETMRNGRIRSALAAMAEHVSNSTFHRTLALYIKDAVLEPDAELAEFERFQDDEFKEFQEAFRADGPQAVEDTLGECVPQREDSLVPEDIARVTGVRMARLENDPETEDTEGDDGGPGLLKDVFVEPGGIPDLSGEVQGEGGSDDGIEPEEGPQGSEGAGEGETTPEEEIRTDLDVNRDIGAYLVAWIKKHRSPVIARGVRAYITNGTSAMAQEMKMTRAPRKTLAAVVTLAASRYRKVALIYDHFELWRGFDDEARAKVLGALSEIRWALGEGGVMVLMVVDDSAPELEAQFMAASTQVRWDMPGLFAPEDRDQEDAIVSAIIAEAELREGSSTIQADDEHLARLRESAEGEFEAYLKLAAAAVDDAADRDLDGLDDAAVQAALGSVSEDAS